MEDLNKTTYFYRVKFKSKEAQYNKPMQLPAYFGPMIGDKKKVLIAELGAGPINTIGNSWPDVEVEIKASDMFSAEYNKFWRYHGKTPIVPVEYEDMENLTYSNETFDIVHCVNALDHTPDAKKAISEAIRVCKKGGWIYFRHAPNQRKRFGGMHAWDITSDGQDTYFAGSEYAFKLEGFKTHLEGDLIVSICQKPI